MTAFIPTSQAAAEEAAAAFRLAFPLCGDDEIVERASDILTVHHEYMRRVMDAKVDVCLWVHFRWALDRALTECKDPMAVPALRRFMVAVMKA